MITHTAHINIISKAIYHMDCLCRTDFQKDAIISERDYISIFLNYIRHPFGIWPSNSVAYAQTLPEQLETKLGCDGIIVFKYDQTYKIGLFEAKVIKPKWDNRIKKAKISRFQRQLNKQRLINPGIATWEMFLNKNYAGITYDPNGSTCVKATVANSHGRAKPTWAWTLNDLKKLLTRSYTLNSNAPLNIEQIVREILVCNFGALFSYEPDGISFYENSSVKVPIFENTDTIQYEDRDRVFNFLKKTGIWSYTHIDLNKFIQERTVMKRENILGRVL